jgi:hypothetical protein
MALALSGYATDNSTENGHQMSSIVPMIVKVIGDGSSTDVPVTPDTTCSDVIECCRDPGDETCNLVAVCPEHGGKLKRHFPIWLRDEFISPPLLQDKPRKLF